MEKYSSKAEFIIPCTIAITENSKIPGSQSPQISPKSSINRNERTRPKKLPSKAMGSPKPSMVKRNRKMAVTWKIQRCKDGEVGKINGCQ